MFISPAQEQRNRSTGGPGVTRVSPQHRRARLMS